MTEENLTFLFKRPEVGEQRMQRRCFVTSSFRNKERVQRAVTRLRQAGLFTYDFTVAEFSVPENDWGGLSFEDARSNPEMESASRSDLIMLRSLGMADFVLVLLPAGFSAGYEAGYAASRGAHVVVCTESSRQVDLPMLHADHIFESLDECINYIIRAAANAT